MWVVINVKEKKLSKEGWYIRGLVWICGRVVREYFWKGNFGKLIFKEIVKVNDRV